VKAIWKLNESIHFSYSAKSLNYIKTEGLDQKSNQTSSGSKGRAVLEA
jgi:hypothetical protein